MSARWRHTGGNAATDMPARWRHTGDNAATDMRGTALPQFTDSRGAARSRRAPVLPKAAVGVGVGGELGRY